MHYLKCYSILFLIIPTLFLAGLFSPLSFGAVDKPYIITPTKSICCKNDTNAGSESTSTSLASPLKKISTTPIQSDEEDDSGKVQSTSTSLASPLKKINTDAFCWSYNFFLIRVYFLQGAFKRSGSRL